MATIELGAPDTGRDLAARVGDVIVVLLAENATTGYRWHVERCSDPLELASNEFIAPAKRGEAIGRGGHREFRFDVVEAGGATLDLKYWQEWEGDRSTTERLSFAFTVSPS